MSPVSLAIVGAGGRGRTYASFALHHPDRARVVAVAEPDPERRSRLAVAHGVPPDRCFASWHDLAVLPALADAVIITTQDADHEAPLLALAPRGYAILLEKPMAPHPDACRRIAAAVRRHGNLFAVCHVLRYTRYTRRLKALLDEGAAGEIASLQHLEPVGSWHMAHSFVRGHWRNERLSSPMLLAKSCHDLDWMLHIAGAPARRVSSFGSLFHFRPENRPAGAADRCLDCPVEPDCAWSAPRIYLDRVARGDTGWPVNVLTPEPTAESVTRALREGPYGRCVYACDNDVVDHQVVNLELAGGRTASFTMTGLSRGRERETRIFGTRAEIEGDGRHLRIHDFRTGQTTVIDTATEEGGPLAGHGGGDQGLMDAFVTAVATGRRDLLVSNAGETLASHLVVFAAEASRREGRVVSLDEPAWASGPP